MGIEIDPSKVVMDEPHIDPARVVVDSHQPPAAPAAGYAAWNGLSYKPMTAAEGMKTAEEVAPLAGGIVGGLFGSVGGPAGTVLGTGLGAGAGQALVNMERFMRGAPEAPVSASSSAMSIAHQMNTNMAWSVAGEALHGALSYAAKFGDGFLMHPLDSMKQWWMERQIGKGIPESTIENVNRTRAERAMRQEGVGLTPGEQAADQAMIAQENQFMRGTEISGIAAKVDTSRYEKMSDSLLKRINGIADTGDIVVAGKEQVGNEITKVYDELFNVRKEVGKQFQRIVEEGSSYKNAEAVDRYNAELFKKLPEKVSFAEAANARYEIAKGLKADEAAYDSYIKSIYGETEAGEAAFDAISKGKVKAQLAVNEAIDSAVNDALPQVPMIGSSNARQQILEELNGYVGKDLSSTDKATIRALNESLAVRQRTPFVNMKTFDENLKTLREKFWNDGKTLDYSALDRIRDAAYKDLNESNRWIPEGLGEKYAAAVDAYKLSSIPIDNFGDTLVGKMLKLDAPTPERLAEKLFTGKPTEVDTIMNLLAKNGSPATVQNVKALSMKRIYQESLADPGMGLPEGMVDPSKWTANFKKNKPILDVMFKSDPESLKRFEDANMIMAGLAQRGKPVSGLPVEKEYMSRIEGYHVASGFLHSMSNVARAGVDALMESFTKIGPERRLMFLFDPEAQQSLVDLNKAIKAGNQKLAAQRIDKLAYLVSHGGRAIQMGVQRNAINGQ